MKVLLEFGKENDIILDTNTKKRDESDSRRDTEIGSCKMQRQYSAYDRERYIE